MSSYYCVPCQASFPQDWCTLNESVKDVDLYALDGRKEFIAFLLLEGLFGCSLSSYVLSGEAPGNPFGVPMLLLLHLSEFYAQKLQMRPYILLASLRATLALSVPVF